MTQDFITFGPVHLDVTDRERALAFWSSLVGLDVLGEPDGAVELGAGGEPLVVLHPGATSKVRRGHSGLYHLAIHLPSEPELARVLARLLAYRYPVAPTDHIMSKAIYLNDPDGIGLELTLETPERIQVWSVDEDGLPAVIDAEGRRRSGREPLDVEGLLATLPEGDVLLPLPPGTKVGHVHLHVPDLDEAARFYRDDVGFLTHVHSPAIGMSDLHAGGDFPHRMALNIWQGPGAPPPPPGTAGLRHFTLKLDSRERLDALTGRIAGERRDDGYFVRDPAANALVVA